MLASKVRTIRQPAQLVVRPQLRLDRGTDCIAPGRVGRVRLASTVLIRSGKSSSFAPAAGSRELLPFPGRVRAGRTPTIASLTTPCVVGRLSASPSFSPKLVRQAGCDHGRRGILRLQKAAGLHRVDVEGLLGLRIDAHQRDRALMLAAWANQSLRQVDITHEGTGGDAHAVHRLTSVEHGQTRMLRPTY